MNWSALFIALGMLGGFTALVALVYAKLDVNDERAKAAFRIFILMIIVLCVGIGLV